MQAHTISLISDYFLGISLIPSLPLEMTPQGILSLALGP